MAYLGMKTHGDSKDIEEMKCYELANMVVDRRGELRNRMGFLKQNATKLDASLTGVYQYIARDGTKYNITARSTKLETV